MSSWLQSCVFFYHLCSSQVRGTNERCLPRTLTLSWEARLWSFLHSQSFLQGYPFSSRDRSVSSYRHGVP